MTQHGGDCIEDNVAERLRPGLLANGKSLPKSQPYLHPHSLACLCVLSTLRNVVRGYAVEVRSRHGGLVRLLPVVKQGRLHGDVILADLQAKIFVSFVLYTQ